MAMPPSLIGAPVAFLPVPFPHTLFVAEALPDPTGVAALDPPAPVASAVAASATSALAVTATPT